jgi:EAL and modified HD-GYP domain-containing signal transduction protein
MSPQYICRLPIYDRKLRTYGYELRAFGHAANDETDSLSDRLAQIDWSDLSNASPVLVGATPANLEWLSQQSWPKDRVILALPRDPFDDDRVRSLCADGYRIALRPSPELPPTTADQAALYTLPAPEIERYGALTINGARPQGTNTLVFGIEREEEFDRASTVGCDLFQGGFFQRPRLVDDMDLEANRLSVLHLLARLQEPGVTGKEIEDIVRQDATISFKLLRMLNFAFWGVPKEVESIRRAVVFFGLERLRNWASVMLVNAIDFQPRELLTTAMVRARMCEQLACHLGRANGERYYLTGLFSLLDSMMKAPMSQILQVVGLLPEIDEALLRRTGPMGEVLAAVIEFERANPAFASGLTLPDERYPQIAYWDAIRNAAAAQAAF